MKFQRHVHWSPAGWRGGPILPLFVLFCLLESTLPLLFYPSAWIQKAKLEHLIEVRPVAGSPVEFTATGASNRACLGTGEQGTFGRRGGGEKSHSRSIFTGFGHSLYGVRASAGLPNDRQGYELPCIRGGLTSLFSGVDRLFDSWSLLPTIALLGASPGTLGMVSDTKGHSDDCLAVPFVSISQGAASGIADPQEIVIQSEQEWQKLWERHAPSGSAAPPVDFATQVVVGIFAGERPTAGYQVQIVKVELERTRITVIYQVRRSPTDALVPQVLTQPFIIIRIPRLNLPIQFKRV